jgi:hypothetical protein
MVSNKLLYYNLNIPSIQNAPLTKFIDEKLDWKTQLDSITNRINKYVYALKQISRVINIKTPCYYAYVELTLRYGIILWGNSIDSNRAFVAQKKCIRAIYKMRPDESCRPMFKSFDCYRFLRFTYSMCVCLSKSINHYLEKHVILTLAPVETLIDCYLMTIHV